MISMLRIALPNKGRLADDARSVFTDAGLEIRAHGERALTASLGDSFEAIFVRAQDIPEFVADGAANAGITGLDLVAESGRALDSMADLGFGRCESGRREISTSTRSRLPGGDIPRVRRLNLDVGTRRTLDIHAVCRHGV